MLTCSRQAAQPTVDRIAIDLNLFDHIADGSQQHKTVDQLAVMTKTKPDFLGLFNNALPLGLDAPDSSSPVRILRLLDSLGWVRQVGIDGFAPTRITKAMKQKPLQCSITHQRETGSLI